jgi:hypothetical protein
MCFWRAGASVGLIVIPWLLQTFKPNDILAYSIVNFVAGFLVVVAIVYWLVDYWADGYLEEKNKSADEYVDFNEKLMFCICWIFFFLIRLVNLSLLHSFCLMLQVEGCDPAVCVGNH